jgi:hypothetical protein
MSQARRSERREHPKIFISHASEDKDRFVLEFAAGLRAKGIDAWVDKWEMHGGDSLVRRIFEEGIAEADAIIVVLSKVSVSKPWIREELDAAVVRRIQADCRLMPVLLDDVAVPVAIAQLLYYDVRKESLANIVDEITRTMYSISVKPSLGAPPSYTTTPPHDAHTDAVDEVVFEEIYRALRVATLNTLLHSNGIQEKVAAQGISSGMFLESLHALVNARRINATPRAGGIRWRIDGMPDRLWLKTEARNGVDVAGIRQRVLSAAVNGAPGRDLDLELFADLHERTLAATLNELQAERLLKWTRFATGRIVIHSVTPLARRALRGA